MSFCDPGTYGKNLELEGPEFRLVNTAATLLPKKIGGLQFVGITGVKGRQGYATPQSFALHGQCECADCLLPC